MQKDNLRSLAIGLTLGNGNNTMVPGGQLGPGIGSIRVWQIELEANDADTITPFSGTNQIPGTIVFQGAGTSVVFPGTGVPWMECAPGEPLVWNLAKGNTLIGTIWFSIA